MDAPRHIVIIPDGSRRWAEKNSFPVWRGHMRGAEIVEPIALAALEQKVECLTIWGLSMDNLENRSELELQTLFEIFEKYFKKLTGSVMVRDNEVRVRAIGCWKERFPATTVQAIEEATNATKNHTRHSLNFLLADGDGAEPWPDDIPNIDLIIRTGEPHAGSGMGHLSDGMRRWPMKNPLIQLSKTFWPDFSTDEFATILSRYAHFERRAGK